MSTSAEFLQAAKSGDAGVVRERLAADAGLVTVTDGHLKTALHWAAELDHAEVAALLVAAGADIEARTAWGASPLDWAANMGSRRVADLLLARGARGFTLIVAAGLGRLSELKAMVEAGQDLSAHRRRAALDPGDDHWPPDSAHVLGDVMSDALYSAARNGHTDVVAYLLGKGAVIDAKGVFGGTALHWAAINGHRTTVEFLVAHGASRTVRDRRFDSTPEGWAREGGHDEIAELLQMS